MQGRCILVIDDDPSLRSVVQLVFSRAGCQVHTAADGHEGLRQFADQRPDLVILDLMMPEMDGWEVCRRIRLLSDVPIIILSVLEREEHIIRGLDCGADDYVTKPFSPNVLLARARATLRRAEPAPTPDTPLIYSDGHLTIDLDKRQVLVRGEPVRLRATEYRLLAYLLENAERVLTFAQILDKVWGHEYQDSVNYVHVYISHLRGKLEKDPKRPRYLLNVRGVGYWFEKQTPF
jgi:two-component system KDP operon response regulator KdpE